MLASNKANISLSAASLLWPCILPQVRGYVVCLLLETYINCENVADKKDPQDVSGSSLP